MTEADIKIPYAIANFAELLARMPKRTYAPTEQLYVKLGIMFEARVGQGWLMVACIDWKADMENRPATQQLFRSVGRYMQSSRFMPEATFQVYQLDALFDAYAASLETDVSNAAIRHLLNK